jgi:heat-inducible transcriptional repressor
MNERQRKILGAVIKEYTDSAEPVGSKVLVEKYHIKASSATIRNDMADLEAVGFLFQPHTSAGRIPTDKGYRYFVEEIMEDKVLSFSEQKKLQTEFLKLKAQQSRMSRTMAKVLSNFSGSLAITGTEKEVYDFGIRELLSNPEFSERDEFR